MKRRMVQVISALLTNPHIPGFIKGGIYQGSMKMVCVPGMNCYSCPAATAACPIGAMQAVIGSRKFSFSFYPGSAALIGSTSKKLRGKGQASHDPIAGFGAARRCLLNRIIQCAYRFYAAVGIPLTIDNEQLTVEVSLRDEFKQTTSAKYQRFFQRNLPLLTFFKLSRRDSFIVNCQLSTVNCQLMSAE